MSTPKPAADAGDFKPTTFTRTDGDGVKKTLTANSPADAVRLRFEGWTEAGSAPRPAPPRSTTTPTAGTAGA